MVYITRRNAPYASIQVSVFFLFSEMRLNETPNASGFGHFYFAKLRKCSFSAILWPIGLGKKKKKGKNYREENYHPHSPPCSDTPSPPWDPAPAQPLWLWNLFPPPHPKDNINPHDSSILGRARSPGAPLGPPAAPEHLPCWCRALTPEQGRRRSRRCRISRSILTLHQGLGAPSETWQTHHTCPRVGGRSPPARFRSPGEAFP